MRVGVAAERTEDTRLRDRDCTSTAPPALFGCDAGIDARPLGAYGDFGRSIAPEIALGLELSTRARAEVALSRRSLELDADANFVGVTGDQPVRADAAAWTALARVTLDLAPDGWRVRPFVSAGGGLSRNRLDHVVYSFPGIAPDAVTITRGGTSTELAWSIDAGLAIGVTDRVYVDLGLRQSDFGELRAERGVATIVRPNRMLEIEIDETRSDLGSRALFVALRVRL